MYKGQQVHAYVNGSLYEGTFYGDVISPLVPQNEIWSLMETTQGDLVLCRRSSLRATKVLPPLVPSRA